VPAGTLDLPKYLFGEHDVKVGRSDFGNKVRAALAKPYYVSTASLQEEFQGWFTHKTLAILPEGEERHERGQWTRSEGAGVSTAGMAEDFLKSFMGYCALPQDSPDPYLRGQGLKLEELSMALLADKELVEKYLEFIRLRSGLRVKPVEDATRVADLPAHQISADGKWEFYDKGGKYNKRSLLALTYVSSLLRPGTGYLYQHPEFAEKLGSRMKAASWQEQCVQTRSRVDDLRKKIALMKKENNQEHYDFGRDPKEPIQWILDLQRPILILYEMIKAMHEDLLPESANKWDRARQYRDILLVSLLCANPLRIRMLSIMEFGKHLIRRSDGSWWLKFNKRAFKNRRALKSHYEVRVAPELWPMLDRYKEEFHPLLTRATGSSHVFIGGAATGKYQGHPMTAHSLGKIIVTFTQLYIPGEVGFGPHAFRHIIATDIIKKDPRIGFFLAAVALHDKLETVETEYIHLKTSEFFEPVNAHFGEAWSLIFDSPLK
jgi:integrase